MSDPSYRQPTCEDEADVDQGAHRTLVESLKSTKKKKPPVPGSDSGYSSLSKTSKTSTTSSRSNASKTPKPSRQGSTLSKIDTGVPASSLPPSSLRTSSTRASSRSSSKARHPSPSYPEVNASTARMSTRPTQRPPTAPSPGGHWERTSSAARPPPSPAIASSPATDPYRQQPHYTYQAVAPPTDPYGPPPAAVPRPSRRPSLPPRPFSLAAPEVAPYGYTQPTTPQQMRPPSTFMTHAAAPAPRPPPPQPPPPPPPVTTAATVGYAAPRAAPADGEWVRNARHSRGLSYSTQIPPRPTVPHRLTDYAAPPEHFPGPYGQPQIEYSSTPPAPQVYPPPDPYYEQSRRAIPPAPVPGTQGYPPRSASRAPPPLYDTRSRRLSQSVDYEQQSYADVYDPDRTIRARPANLRPSLLDHPSGKSRSESRYISEQSRHPGAAVMVERTAPRQRKLSRHMDEAQKYQKRRETAAFDDDDELDDFETGFRQMSIDNEPAYRRPSDSGHGRSRSRAGSSISRLSTGTGALHLIMDGNAVELSGDTEGRNISFSTGEDGRAIVTMGSPSKTREKSYIREGSTKSGASFASRMRKDSERSPTETTTGVTGNMSRRRSTAAGSRSEAPSRQERHEKRERRESKESRGRYHK